MTRHFSGVITCVGGAVVDRKYQLHTEPVRGTSNPASGSRSFGGVARNVAENLARLGTRVALVSRVGDDDTGAELLRYTARAGVDVARVTAVPGRATAEYVAVLGPSGELGFGVAVMEVLDELSAVDVDAAWATSPAWVMLDCNPPAAAIAHAIERAADGGPRLAVDAVSTVKVRKLPRDLDGIAVLFCNGDEARAWLGDGSRAARTRDVAAAGMLCDAGAESVVLTRGEQGVVVADATGTRELPALPARVVDVTGAGDALVAGTVHALAAGAALAEAVTEGMRVAAVTVESPHSVRPDLRTRLDQDIREDAR